MRALSELSKAAEKKHIASHSTLAAGSRAAVFDCVAAAHTAPVASCIARGAGAAQSSTPDGRSLFSQASDVSFSLDLDERQLGRLVQALDRDGDGLINYDEFLTGLEMRDVMEL